ncbi:hypothetical protein EfmJHP36_22090 [Enterococcus faecium]|nr:hypothetical protein EfmJHP36_22090 [Enterococcus faecium]
MKEADCSIAMASGNEAAMQTEIVQTLVTKGDLNELFRSHLEKAINTLLRTASLFLVKNEKYDRTGFNSGNSRNGSYFRSIKTEYGELTLEIPRDRNGEFKQQTLPAYKRTNDTLETTIIHLFEKGVTMSEIADLIEKMYGHHYTPQTMSNMTKVLTEEVNAFKSRALNDKYVAIFMDATYIPLKRQTVSKEAIYIAIGIREDGTKEVLSYAIAPTESTYVWNELLVEYLFERKNEKEQKPFSRVAKNFYRSIKFILKQNISIVVSMYLVISLIKYVSKTEKKSVMTLRLFIKLTQKKKRIPSYPA